MTVILITHKLYEVMAISHRVGGDAPGEAGGPCGDEADDGTPAGRHDGRPGGGACSLPPKEGKSGEPLVSVENLEVRDHRGLPAVQGVSFQVHAHEVLGIAAVEGNGQSELLKPSPVCGPLPPGRCRFRGAR